MSSSANEAVVPEIDTSRPHAARVYDYYLGGKDNFAADREMAEKAQASWPDDRTSARENRAFLGRAVRYLAGQAGIRQFLDIGAGLPSATTSTRSPRAPPPPAASSTWTTTRWCWPTRVRCSSPGPRAGPPTSTPTCHPRASWRTRSPARYWTSPSRSPSCSWGLAPCPDEDKPRHHHDDAPRRTAPGQLPRRVPRHGGIRSGRDGRRGARFPEAGVPFQTRDSGEFARLAFTGLELVPPGVVVTSEWRPEDDGPRPMPAEVNTNGGVALKP